MTCSLATETGTDMLHPLTEATKTDGGWLINGQKSFGTLSPTAHLCEITCRVRHPQRGERLAQVRIPRESPGLDIKNNWDALGMRASGSHDVVFTNCFIPDTALVDVSPWGKWSEGWLVGLMAMTMGLVGAFLGIAEAAHDLTIETVTTRRKGPGNRRAAERYPIQHTIAEIEIDLAASRAMLERTATTTDTFFSLHPVGSVPLHALHQLMKDFQCTKWVVTRKAIEIVDRALTVSGGAGYLSAHPLSRLYRDVRAGPFMQPFSPNEAFEYISENRE